MEGPGLVARVMMMRGHAAQGTGRPEDLLSSATRRLATPWSVASWRADVIADRLETPGIIVDPACGSGLALAALAGATGRFGLGVELDAAAVESSLDVLPRWLPERAIPSLGVWVGDGLAAADALAALASGLGVTAGALPPVAMLHLDPARPLDSGESSLSAFDPPLNAVFAAWVPHLVAGVTGPAMQLDLPPRLRAEQREQVEAMVLAQWPETPMQWAWLSQGRGRVDRLALLTGELAGPASSVTRLFADGTTTSITGQAGFKPDIDATPLADDEYVGLLDPVVLSAGLWSAWQARVAPIGEAHLRTDDGRRPLVTLPSGSIDVEAAGFVLVSGQVVRSFEAGMIERTQKFVELLQEAGMGRVTLRLPLDPEVQPPLQRLLDRSLPADGPPGHLLRGPDGVVVCIRDESVPRTG